MNNSDSHDTASDLADATRILVAHTLSGLHAAAAEQVNRVHAELGGIQTTFRIKPGSANARVCLIDANGNLVAQMLSAGGEHALAYDAGVAAAQVTAEAVRQLPAHVQPGLVDAVFNVSVTLQPHAGYVIAVFAEHPEGAAFAELARIVSAPQLLQ